MKKIAVILAGCGVYDGAEIQEAVLTLLAIDNAGATYSCFAPDILQHHVVNHVTGEEMAEKRNVLTESARIARGDIRDLSLFESGEFDGMVFPGGFGAAKNLCNWAFAGDDCIVNPQVERAVRQMYETGKPVGAMCIAPVILAALFHGKRLTTGRDPASAGFIEHTGNEPVMTGHGEVVCDESGKLFSTPCYMLEASISQIAEGTRNLVQAMLKAM
jgi:enhancing lycopene biosynthesis protein 2